VAATFVFGETANVGGRSQGACGPPPTFAVSSNTKVAASIVPPRRCPAEIVDGGHRRSRHEFRETRSLLAQPLIEHFEHSALEPVTIMSV
jgi:hypothetical protein